ncbi:hypothetical protein [Paraburkholderia diazotrophica]|uniref:Secretion system X translation initiation factor n=1 Tax=Paraburkholderia diazotrophica TaxID=667676 RepID=A0A1H7E7Z5_9BURK|nr:hypothetical protein [Paraburkholderia diazotrophica]SEK09998.1 hypothetical protein SAMN05192539_104637 [Paraburkholderia diazotrophica]
MNPNFVRRGVLGLCLIATIALSVKEWRASQGSAAMAAVNPARHRATLPPASARDAAKERWTKAPGKTTNAASTVAPSASHAADTSSEKLAALRKPMSLESRNNPFAASSWLPPPPRVVQAPPEPPPPPTAPPVPFVYLGKLDGSTLKPRVFLSSGDQLLIVSQGEIVDGQYRVESISDGDIVLTYLPLNQKQVISIPGEGKQ